jgi:hypothetical protein
LRRNVRPSPARFSVAILRQLDKALASDQGVSMLLNNQVTTVALMERPLGFRA